MGPHKGPHKVTNDHSNKPKWSMTLCTLSFLFKAKLWFFFFYNLFFLCLNVSIPQSCYLISSSTVHPFQRYCNSDQWFQNLYPRASSQVLEPYFQFLLVHVNLDLSDISTSSHQSSHLQMYSFSSIPLINVISNLTSQAKNQIILYYSFTP